MNKKIRGFLTIMLACVMVVAFGACSVAPAAPKVTPEVAAVEEVAPKKTGISAEEKQKKLDTTLYVGFAVRTFSNPYFVTMSEGAKLFVDWLDEIGQKYVYEVMLNEGSSDEQINQISAFLAKSGGNAILMVDPNEAAIASKIADLVEEAGAFMVTTWNKPAEVNVSDYDHWVSHHSPDDVQYSYEIAVEMFSQFKTPFEGKVIAIQGLLGNTPAIKRYAGLVKALAEYPKVKLVADESADWAATKALAIMETLLAAHADVDGVWAANDNMALGVIQALEAKGLAGKVKVVGINAIPNAVAAIKNGKMTATVDVNGWGQGGYSLAIAYDAWLGNIDVPTLGAEYRQFGTAAKIITAANVNEFEQNFIINKPKMDFTNYWAFRTGDFPVFK
jgi:ribose transport system substrate-binding protein